MTVVIPGWKRALCKKGEVLVTIEKLSSQGGLGLVSSLTVIELIYPIKKF